MYYLADNLIFSFLCLFAIYLLFVIYKLLAGSRSLFALALLFLSIVWWMYWFLIVAHSLLRLFFSWALPLQCWIFANRYYQSYLKSNANTTKFSLTMHTYITLIFSMVIVALCIGLGYLGSYSQLWNCLEKSDYDYSGGCVRLLARN
jgi:hypothetical protein